MGRILLPIDPAGMGYQRQNHDYVSTYQSPWAQVGPHVLVNTAIPLAGQALNAGITSAANAYNKSQFEDAQGAQGAINDAANRAPADLAAMRGGAQPAGSPRALAASGYGAQSGAIGQDIGRGTDATMFANQARGVPTQVNDVPLSGDEMLDASQRAAEFHKAQLEARNSQLDDYAALTGFRPDAGMTVQQKLEANPSYRGDRAGGAADNPGVIDLETGEPVQLAGGPVFFRQAAAVRKAVVSSARAQAAHEAAAAAPGAVRAKAVQGAMDQAGHQLSREYVPTPRPPVTRPPHLPNTGVAPAASPELEAAYAARRAQAAELAGIKNPLNAGHGTIDVGDYGPPRPFVPDARGGVLGSTAPHNAAEISREMTEWAQAVQQGEAGVIRFLRNPQADIAKAKVARELADQVRSLYDDLKAQRLLGNPDNDTAARAVLARTASPAQMLATTRMLNTVRAAKGLGALGAATVGAGAVASAMSPGSPQAAGSVTGAGLPGVPKLAGAAAAAAPTVGPDGVPLDETAPLVYGGVTVPPGGTGGRASGVSGGSAGRAGGAPSRQATTAQGALSALNAEFPDAGTPAAAPVAAPATPPYQETDEDGNPVGNAAHPAPPLLDPRKLHSYQAIMNAAKLAKTPEQQRQVLDAAERSGLQDAPAESWLDVINPTERTNRGFAAVRQHIGAGKVQDPLADIKRLNYESQIAGRKQSDELRQRQTDLTEQEIRVRTAKADEALGQERNRSKLLQEKVNAAEIDNRFRAGLAAARLGKSRSDMVIAAINAADQGDKNQALIRLQQATAGLNREKTAEVHTLVMPRLANINAQTAMFGRMPAPNNTVVNMGAKQNAERQNTYEKAYNKAKSEHEAVSNALAIANFQGIASALKYLDEDAPAMGSNFKAVGQERLNLDALKRKLTQQSAGLEANLKRAKAQVERMGFRVNDDGTIDPPPE